MSDLRDLLGIIGTLGNAAGIRGDTPGGLNALQRMDMADPNIQASALSTLASDPNFKNADPAARQAMIQQAAPSAAQAQIATGAKSAAALNPNNPREMVAQSIQSGLMTPAEGVTALANPQLQIGQLSQLNNQPAQVNNAVSQPSATTLQQHSGIDYNYLTHAKQLSPQAGTMAENMIAGVFNPESGKGENDPVYNMALTIARRADASFTPQSLIGRPQMVKNSTSGDMYKNETNMNTAAAHLYDLHELAPLTRNMPESGQFPNMIGRYETLGLGGQPAEDIKRYEATVGQASPEIAKYLSGVGATIVGTEEAGKPFDSTLPPNSIQTNAKDMFGKMVAKGKSLQDEYNTSMGAAATKQIIHPNTAALYKDMQGQPLTIQEQQMVNQHRAESNLPPKTWGRDRTIIGNQPMPLNVPDAASSTAPETKAQPQITPEMARAEMARRKAAKGAK